MPENGDSLLPLTVLKKKGIESQMIIPGSCYWNLGFGREKGEVKKDKEAKTIMTVLGENMAWLLARVSKS